MTNITQDNDLFLTFKYKPNADDNILEGHIPQGRNARFVNMVALDANITAIRCAVLRFKYHNGDPASTISYHNRVVSFLADLGSTLDEVTALFHDNTTRGFPNARSDVTVTCEGCDTFHFKIYIVLH